ncbi:hypothetical protein LguiB_018831 [Lonicera macranthoides]
MRWMAVALVVMISSSATTQVRSDGSAHKYKAGDQVPLYTNRVGPFRNPRVSRKGSPLKGNHCSSWLSKGSCRGKKDEIGERTLKGASTPSKVLISFVCAYRRGVVFSTLGRQQQKDLIHRVRFINSKSHTRSEVLTSNFKLHLSSAIFG